VESGIAAHNKCDTADARNSSASFFRGPGQKTHMLHPALSCALASAHIADLLRPATPSPK